MQTFDSVVIGAGAAGLMCGIEAGKRGKSVLILDHAPKAGRKILISGGGRCNFTNTGAGPAQYVSQNPHFCASALSRYTAEDFIHWVKSHGISFHEKKLGQLFCDGSAGAIVDMLLQEADQANVEIRLEQPVRSVRKAKFFETETSHGTVQSQSLIVATGGLSMPKLGATDLGYRIARQFGLNVIEPRPALDGFLFSTKDLKLFGGLQGISLDTILRVGSAEFRENILFTHVGVSGPAALQASLYWEPGTTLHINLFPGETQESFFEWWMGKKRTFKKAKVKTVLSERLAGKVAERLCDLWMKGQAQVGEVSNQDIRSFCTKLLNWEITPKRTVGFAKAEVTKGGIDTTMLSSKTMEAKEVPGLYFIGEVVDVTGWLGGYNFQWAWSSGWAAGNAIGIPRRP